MDLSAAAGYNAEGFEFSKESADWGSAHYGLPIHTEPIESGTYPVGAYDLVSMTDVLEHTLHPVDYLKQRRIRRLHRRGICLKLFINTCLSFVIVAFAVFLLVRAINRLKRAEEQKAAEPPATPEEVVLLREVRDGLKTRSS